MGFRTQHRVLFSLFLLGLPAGRAAGQTTAIGASVNQLLFPAEGVARSCLESAYSTGIGTRVMRGAVTRVTSLELTGRAYVIARGSTCIDGFPPPDGVYIQDDRTNLLAAPFASTDVRFRARLSTSQIAPSIAAGLGYTWRAHHNPPYLLLDLQLPLAPFKGGRISVEGELLYIRIASDRFRRTYRGFQLVAEESLGRHYRWGGVLSLALVTQVKLP